MKNKKRIEISRFDNFNSDNKKNQVEMFYNFLPTNKLLNSRGIEEAKFPYTVSNQNEYSLNFNSFEIEKIDGVAFFKQYVQSESKTYYRLLVHGSDNKIYINQVLYDDDGLQWVYGLTFNTPPITLPFKQNDTDSIIIADDTKMVIWKTSHLPYIIENTPVITSMGVNDGILFCTIVDPGFKVWYTLDLNAENIGDIGKNSGYISFNDELGDAKKIVVLNEDVYVFREYGISKITIIKNEFIVSEIYKSNTKILHNTIAVCGNLVWFMTNYGLYTFNGTKVNKSIVDVAEMLDGDNKNATSASLGEDYYLALKLKFDNSSVLCETNQDCVNNAVIVINTSNNKFEIIRGVDIGSLCPIKIEHFEKMLCTFNSGHKLKLGQICKSSIVFENSLPKFWASSNLVEGDEMKAITRLTVYAKKDVKVKLEFDDGTNKEFETYKSGLNEFVLKKYCKDLKVNISSNKADAEVEKIYIDYYEN